MKNHVTFNLRSAKRRRQQPKPVAAMIVLTVAATTLAHPLTAYAGSTIFNNALISDTFGVDFAYSEPSGGLGSLTSLTPTANGGSVQNQLASMTVSSISTTAFTDWNANGRSFTSLGFQNISSATGLSSMNNGDVLEIYPAGSIDATINLALSESTTFQWDLSFISDSWGGQIFIDIDNSLSGANGGPIEDLMIDGSLSELSNNGTFDLHAGSHTFVFNTIASGYASASNSVNDLSLTSGFDIELSYAYSVPGPGAIASLLGVTAMRRRRRR